MKSKIDVLVEHIENKLLAVKQSSAIEQHLYYIKSILKQSETHDDRINIAKIHEAIHYIETIKIEQYTTFFAPQSRSMAELLQRHEEVIFPDRERRVRPLSLQSKQQSDAVIAKSHTLFGPIHGTLMDMILERLQFAKNAEINAQIKNPPVAWEYEYPLDEGEVMNQAIGEWQAARMEFPESQDELQKDYKDFQRNISIRGLTGKSADEVTDLLTYLVCAANYPEHDKAAIKYWLQERGGQDNNRFLDLLLMSGEFTACMESGILKTRGIEQNWTLECGKIVLFYESVVYALMINGSICVNDGRGGLSKELNPEKIKSENNLPLMRVRAKIELNINSNHNVVPQITALSVTSFSPNLVKPEPLEQTLQFNV